MGNNSKNIFKVPINREDILKAIKTAGPGYKFTETFEDYRDSIDAKDDKVNHPNHYTFGSIEVINYIRDKMTPDEFQGYCMGNILKYVSRHKHKNGVEDLKKAQVYLGWLIESEEGAK